MNEAKSEVIILGRLGSDPELKYTMKQEPICTFSVAERVEDDDRPVWHKIVVWGKSAEQCKVNLKKGNFVFVRGRNHEKEFIDMEGNSKVFKEVRATHIGLSLL